MVNIKSRENTFRILLALFEGDKRFSQLLKETKKASLGKELIELLALKYITRTLVDSKPPHTFYSITKKGEVFLQDQVDEQIPELEIKLKRMKKVSPSKVRRLIDNL